MLDRAVSRETSLIEGVKLALISMDSTLRSNLSVGMPLDLLVYQNDSIDNVVEQRISEGDEYFEMLRSEWSKGLTEAHTRIPPPDWLAP
jgi:putative proteasome-type protease